MMTKLVCALGLAMLAASFTFGSSFACSGATETTASALQTVVPESEAKVTENLSAQTSTTEAQIAEVGQPASVVSEIEPSPIDASPAAAIQFVDAIVVEITQTVTVVVPGQTFEDNEELEHTGSIPESIPERPATAPDLVLDARTTALDEVQ